MDESPSEIERAIAAERHQLGRNLEELGGKAHELVDWRTHYRNNPALMLTLALGGGLVLGAMTGSGGSSRDDSHESDPYRRRGNRASRQLSDTLLAISEAVLGMASAKVMEFVGNAIPGFSEQIVHRQPDAGFGSAGTVYTRPGAGPH
jgi:hypothetical protein